MEYKFKLKENDNDPELTKLLDECARAYNNLMVYMIKKELGYDVKIVDDNHISIDGVVMDPEEFQDWLDFNYPIDEEEYDDEPHHYDA